MKALGYAIENEYPRHYGCHWTVDRETGATVHHPGSFCPGLAVASLIAKFSESNKLTLIPAQMILPPFVWE